VQKGFEDGTYHSLLDAAGYPVTGVLPPRNQAQPEASSNPNLPEVKPAASAEPEKAAGPYAPGGDSPPPPPTKKKLK
jgi:hypothetical protein